MNNDQIQTKYRAIQKENALLRSDIVRLERLAYYDSLSNLIYNKNGFELELSKEIDNFTCWSYLFIDIDNFHEINETFGHLGADKLLKRIIINILKKLNNREPCNYIMYRPYGGDEIGVILMGMNESVAVCLAENIRRAIVHDTVLSDSHVTISIGVSEMEREKPRERRASKRDFSILKKHADLALMSSKKSGKNIVCRWSTVEDKKSTKKTSADKIDK